jgi:hypothetical protein
MPRLPPERRQCDRNFYGLINLAKALTGDRRMPGPLWFRKRFVNGWGAATEQKSAPKLRIAEV